MSPFLKRTVSGLLFVITVVAATLLGRYAFFIVFASLMVACLLEFYRLAHHARIRPQILLGTLLGLILFAACYLFAIGRLGEYIFIGLIPLGVSVFIIELFRNQQRPIHNIAVTLLGLGYVAAPFALLSFFVFVQSEHSVGYRTHVILGYFALLWANDCGAYLLGTSLGRHRIFPRVSPKKSWEGLIGGFITTMLAAWGVSMLFVGVPLAHWMLLGLIVATMGAFGDLVESMFKRSLGLKDSGKFLPGHGGFLDRFDAFLLATPIAYFYLEIMMII